MTVDIERDQNETEADDAPDTATPDTATVETAAEALAGGAPADEAVAGSVEAVADEQAEAADDSEHAGAGEGGLAADDPEALRLVEALLFAAVEPLDEASIAARLPEGSDVAGLLAALQTDYAGRGVNLVRVAKKWALRTAPDLGERLQIEREASRRLSRAAIETLAIVAYHQPITRAEVENIRGVAVNKGTLDVLLEAGWIKPGRRREVPGRPVTWLTTEGFLDHFGLESLKDLPGVKELKAAGLLDTRPAISVYAERASDVDGDTDDGDDAGVGDDDAIEPLLEEDAPAA